MGQWRYYAQRIGSGLWLDTNVQASDVEFTWKKNAPGVAQAFIPSGIGSTMGEDGRPVWGRMDTMFYAEEDGNLAWAGFCANPVPSGSGTRLELVDPLGWLAGVPYTGVYRRWNADVFDVVRHLVDHSQQFKPNMPLSVSSNGSNFSVGDIKPPNPPRKPIRRKGQNRKDWKASKAYDGYEEALSDWKEKYGDRDPYEVAWFEAPMIGEEIEDLAKETGFEYRTRVVWKNRGQLRPEFTLDVRDSFASRREDIQFVDGSNLADPLEETQRDGPTFASQVIGLGAGEGRKMRRVTVGSEGDRLYQAQYAQYKSIKGLKRLRRLSQRRYQSLNATGPKITQVVARDIPGFSPLGSIQVGDEVRAISGNLDPKVDAWVGINEITRKPNDPRVRFKVEVVG